MRSISQQPRKLVHPHTLSKIHFQIHLTLPKFPIKSSKNHLSIDYLIDKNQYIFPLPHYT
nr:MAG TPA: hypothetical protein [Bacteriophage sp.]DAX13468.1 MAG TPA: hypothetical protein [Bacteriophage sp.]